MIVDFRLTNAPNDLVLLLELTMTLTRLGKEWGSQNLMSDSNLVSNSIKLCIPSITMMTLPPKMMLLLRVRRSVLHALLTQVEPV